MEALTIDKLNKINSQKNSTDFIDKKYKEQLKECVSQINEILSRHWHLREPDNFHYCAGEYPAWEYDVFYTAQKLFLENRIKITYYQPHRNFSFQEIKDQ